MIFIGCGATQSVAGRNSSATTPEFVDLDDEFVWLKGGMDIQMGDEDLFGRPVRFVNLSPFVMAKYQTTQSDFEKVMGYNKSWFSDRLDNPVEMVSWYEAVQYCLQKTLQTHESPIVRETIEQWLIPTEKYANQPALSEWAWVVADNEDFDKCMAYLEYALGVPGCYRLPTNAEWEYALRAKTDTKYIWGDDYDQAEANAHSWNSDNSGGTTQPVGGKLANGFSLHDMLGNVWEWCIDGDLKKEDSFSSLGKDNPVNLALGRSESHVYRGGDWRNSNETNIRSGYHTDDWVANRCNFLGFRLVRTVE